MGSRIGLDIMECYLCMELEEKEQCPESCRCLATKYKIIILQEAFTNKSKEEQGLDTVLLYKISSSALAGYKQFLEAIRLGKNP